MSYNRTASLDIAKLLFAILIVSLHSNAFSEIDGSFAFFINQIIARIGVPFFFISSGYFVARHIENDNIGKIYKHIYSYLKYFVIFYLIYMPLTFMWSYNEDFSILYNISKYIQLSLFLAPAYLWYLMALIVGLFIMTKISKISIVYTIVLVTMIYIIGVLGNSYMNILPKNRIIDFYFSIFITTRNGLFFALPYIFSGYYIYIKRIKVHKSINIICVLLFLLIYSIEVLYVHDQFTVINQDTSLYFFLLPLSIFVFLLISTINVKNSAFSHMSSKLSTYIYLLQFGFIAFCIILNKYIAQYEFFSPTLTFIFVIFGSVILFCIIELFFKKRLNND